MLGVIDFDIASWTENDTIRLATCALGGLAVAANDVYSSPRVGAHFAACEILMVHAASI